MALLLIMFYVVGVITTWRSGKLWSFTWPIIAFARVLALVDDELKQASKLEEECGTVAKR